MNMVREKQIQDRLRQIPKVYRAIYKSATKGKSRKSAIHSFCLECCGYEKESVRQCTDSGCCLYEFRPYKERSKHSDKRLSFPPESTN
ncbi:hypothetical protein ACFLZ8_02475 [Planctomycetota bacterium]